MAQQSPIQFVVTLPNSRSQPNQTTISQAQSSEARSHAARVSHLRRRAKDFRQYKGCRSTRAACQHKNQVSHAVTTSPLLLKHENSECSDVLAPDPSLNLKFITTSQLDPFVQLALNLDTYDKNLIHKCEPLEGMERILLICGRSHADTLHVWDNARIALLSCPRGNRFRYCAQRSLAD